MGAVADQLCPREKKENQHANLKQSYLKKIACKLPKGLIGAKCIAGECNCLLDTGSQVTTVPESFYKQNLPSRDIKALHGLLEVEGAAGQPVPYLCYIEMLMTFPKDFLEVDIEIPTLALVPDAHPHGQSLVSIGTNTTDTLYERYLDMLGSTPAVVLTG